MAGYCTPVELLSWLPLPAPATCNLASCPSCALHKERSHPRRSLVLLLPTCSFCFFSTSLVLHGLLRHISLPCVSQASQLLDPVSLRLLRRVHLSRFHLCIGSMLLSLASLLLSARLGICHPWTVSLACSSLLALVSTLSAIGCPPDLASCTVAVVC